MSLRMSLIKRAASKITANVKDKTRFVSSNIGKNMLYDILNDIDMLDNQNRDIQRYGENQDLAMYANPTYIYEKYKNFLTQGENSNELMTFRERLIRSSLYKHMAVFDALKYASRKVNGNKRANSYLFNIFRPTVIDNILISARAEMYVYKSIVKKNNTLLERIIHRVYVDREKWITGLTTKGMHITMKKVDTGYPFSIYFEMRSSYRGWDRGYGYYARAMNEGIYRQRDLPTLGEIYGWLKRRESEGKYRPLVAVGWQRRNSRSPWKMLSTAPRDVELKPYEAAYLIMTRMQRRFMKRGRLSPFGNFSKYRKLNNIYKESIFTVIFDKYVSGIDTHAEKTKGLERRDLEKKLYAKVNTAINSIKNGYKKADRDIRSMNYLIRTNDFRFVGDIKLTDDYSTDSMKKLVNLAKLLKLRVGKK